MPSTLTHWRIVIESLRQFSPADQVAPTAVKMPIVPANDPGHGIPIVTFLGAIGPDLPYNVGITTRSLVFPSKEQRTERGKSAFADLMHYNMSGQLVIALLQQGSQVSSAELRQKIYYYALGHVSHIAGDIIMHPFTNTFAGAYHHQSNPALFNNLGIHFAIEFSHDLATDREYFHARSNALRRRPWLRYLAGARAELTHKHNGVSLFDVLSKALRSLYGFSAPQTDAFAAQLLSGLHGMQTLLGLLRYYPLVNPFVHLSPKLVTYFRDQAITLPGSGTQTLTFDQVLTYAIQVSTHLCALLSAYFADLTAGAAPDGAAYQRLRLDLRDWNLDTGYYLDQQEIAAEQQLPLITMRHSWYHFLALRGAR